MSGGSFHLHRASVWHTHEGGARRHGHSPGEDVQRWWMTEAADLLGDPDGWTTGPHPDVDAARRAVEVPTVVDFPGDPEAQRRIVFVVPTGSPVPPVGTPVSVPVEADWLELGTIAAGRVVNGGIELTLELHKNLVVAGGADTNESVA